MSAYYNEIDREAAAWLRQLIAADLIAPGDVDERDIRDVTPSDVLGYTQCHWFAGIGVWSLALRRAGWPDDRPVWTGSCPCQPFSPAGKGAGIADERHLWPSWFWHICQCRPGAIFGEQVADRGGPAWLDIVSSDLEGEGYTIGPVDTCAAGFGAPHRRQRLYWVAHDPGLGRDGRRPGQADEGAGEPERRGHAIGVAHDARLHQRDEREGGLGGPGAAGGCGPSGDMAQPRGERCGGRPLRGRVRPGPSAAQSAVAGDSRGMADDRGLRLDAPSAGESGVEAGAGPQDGHDPAGHCGTVVLGQSGGPGLARRPGEPGDDGAELAAPERADTPTAGYWADAEWIWCKDERFRPIEPGSFPLAHGTPARMGRLRGYGNSLVAPQAEAFVRVAMEVLG